MGLHLSRQASGFRCLAFAEVGARGEPMVTHNIRQLQEISLDRVLEKVTSGEGNLTNSERRGEFLVRSRGRPPPLPRFRTERGGDPARGVHRARRRRGWQPAARDRRDRDRHHRHESDLSRSARRRRPRRRRCRQLTAARRFAEVIRCGVWWPRASAGGARSRRCDACVACIGRGPHGRRGDSVPANSPRSARSCCSLATSGSSRSIIPMAVW